MGRHGGAMFESAGGKAGVGAAAGVAVLGGAVLVVVGMVGVWWATWEPEVAPEVDYAPKLPAEAAQVEGIDLGRVHRELWTELSVGNDGAGPELVEAFAADEALQGIVAELVEVLDDRAAADAQVEVYNAALAARGMPWAVKTGTNRGQGYTKSYWLTARPVVRLGEHSSEVSLGVRVDPLNVREGWLGIQEDVGAPLVVVNRVVDFATNTVWPLLGDEADPHGAAIRRAAEARLSPEHLAVLLRTSEARRGMMAAQHAVDERRSCGSSFRMRIDWAGLDDLAKIRGYAQQTGGGSCPGITPAEADAVVRGTLAIRSEPLLPEALEALTAWLARHVAYHEARHAVDQEQWGSRPRCSGCEGLSEREVSEVSAYLASLASDESVAAWVQGCRVAGMGRGAGARALKVVFRELTVGCDVAPPDDLAVRASGLAQAWFERDEAASIDAFPDRLPLFVSVE